MIQISGGKSALWWEQKRQMSGGKSDKLGGVKSDKGKWTTAIQTWRWVYFFVEFSKQFEQPVCKAIYLFLPFPKSKYN